MGNIVKYVPDDGGGCFGFGCDFLFGQVRGKRHRWRSRRSARRLINLIFAGRNRMLIIRRELPRTKKAGLVIETYCIKRMRVLLFVGPSTATSTAYLPSLSLGGVNGLAALISGRRRQGVVLVLRHYAKGPDKTQEFPPDGGYDLGLVFPLAEQLSIAAMQSMLGFPGNLFHLRAEVGLSFQKIASQPRSELIGPGGFDHDASQMSVARLGDPGLDPAGAARVFAGNQAAVTHELSGAGEARQFADFGDDGDGTDLGDPAKRLQGLDHGAHARRCRAGGFADGRLQSGQALGPMFDLMNVIDERDLQRWQIEMDFHFDPFQMGFRPSRLHSVGPADAMAEKELTQPLAGPVLISFRRLSGSHQVPQRLMRGIGHPHWGKVSGSMATRQFLSVPPIGL